MYLWRSRLRGTAVSVQAVTATPEHPYHVPVLAEAVARLAQGARRAVDCTAGGGGHAALLVAGGAQLLAVDRDPEAIEHSRNFLPQDRVRFLTGRFASPEVLQEIREFAPDFILLDLGVSARQLEAVERGFSFRPGVPLDMRMNRLDPSQPTAADVLNQWSEETLARLFRENADERRARRLARTIVKRRSRQAFQSSDDLVGAIREALGARTGPRDFARIFQAVRMAVNREREELEAALPQLLDALVPGGILVVITYHSGEDRIVKHRFKVWSRTCTCPPGQPVCTCGSRARGRLLTPRPVRPGADEVAANPRARSAKLRAFQKLDAP